MRRRRRTKRIAEIRAAEGATRREISANEEELRQLVDRSYRYPPEAPTASASAASPSPSGGRARLYAAAARAKYLVDTPEHICGRLDEGLLLEAAGRYMRPQVMHRLLSRDAAAAVRFPLLEHQAQLVDAFRPQIAQRARERFADRRLPVAAHADALAAAAAIDAPSLTPKIFRLEFKAAHPDEKGVAAVGKAGGEKWRSMTDEEKKPYFDQAEELRAQFDKGEGSAENNVAEAKNVAG